jgi:pyridoxamine 5'-phosphate oxidase
MRVHACVCHSSLLEGNSVQHDIASLRKEYKREELTEGSVAPNPFEQFRHWLDEACSADVPEPTAMTLATADEHGVPSARTVLLKGFDETGFVWYTNYASEKGRCLEQNPVAALLFFWPDLERQIRIAGRVERVSREESEAYFHSRPRESQLGAWASQQSAVVASRDDLDASFAAVQQQFAEGVIPLPPTWGGYRLSPSTIEFWQGRPSRMHDRIRYRKDGEQWVTERLAP